MIARNTDCTDMYVDGRFYSEEVVKLGEEGVDIHFTNLSGSKPKDKLSVTAYENKESKVIKRYPKGEAPIYVKVKNGQSVAHFLREVCMACEFRDRCYCKLQKRNGVVRISIKAVETVERREEGKARREENTSK